MSVPSFVGDCLASVTGLPFGLRPSVLRTRWLVLVLSLWGRAPKPLFYGWRRYIYITRVKSCYCVDAVFLLKCKYILPLHPLLTPSLQLTARSCPIHHLFVPLQTLKSV